MENGTRCSDKLIYMNLKNLLRKYVGICFVVFQLISSSCRENKQSQQQKSEPLKVSESQDNKKNIHLVEHPYYDFYNDHSSEYIQKMTLAATDPEFMHVYRELLAKNSGFADISGDVRIALDGLKYQLERHATLSTREVLIASELKSFLMRTAALPSDEPYLSAKIKIGRAYTGLNEDLISPNVDKILENAIEILGGASHAKHN